MFHTNHGKKMMSVIIWWLVAFAGVYLGVVILAYSMQRALVFHPRREVNATPAEIGLEFEDFTVKTADGVSIHGWLVPARAPEEGGLGLWTIFCHGNGGNISHRLDTLRLQHEMGISACIFDYRGYGRSSGKPSEQGVYRDVEAVWDMLLKRGVDPGHVVLWGRSLGGAVAARMASRTNPAGLILESTFTSVTDMARRSYPFLPVSLLCRFRMNTLGHAGEANRNGCPVMVIHSPEDDVVPFVMGEKLHESLSGRRRFLQIQGGHNDGFLLSAPLYTREVRSFLHELVVGK